MTCRALTSNEARTAIYLDFEGRVEQPPVLLGMTPGREGAEQLRQVVLDPRFSPAADRSRLEVVPLPAMIEEVVVLAERGDRLLVGWSHHEEDVVRAYCPEELAQRFSVRYMSAIETARLWRQRTYPRAGRLPEGNRLAVYLRLIGYTVAPVHGPGRTGTSLRILGEAFDHGRAWGDLTGRRKARWSNLLRHNEADVLGLQQLCRVATGGHRGGPVAVGASVREPYSEGREGAAGDRPAFCESGC